MEVDSITCPPPDLVASPLSSRVRAEFGSDERTLFAQRADEPLALRRLLIIISGQFYQSRIGKDDSRVFGDSFYELSFERNEIK